MNQVSTRAAGVFFTRALLGIIFGMQGYGKVFKYTLPKVYELFFKDFETTFLPKWLTWCTAYYTSYIELICGFLLIAGFFRKIALCLLGIDLLIVSFGHGFIEPIWDLSHVIPRAVLVITLLLLPQEWDKWSLDIILKTKK
jgi:uncharacterized membrane protein YphA (DoxX/SURF4 family)